MSTTTRFCPCSTPTITGPTRASSIYGDVNQHTTTSDRLARTNPNPLTCSLPGASRAATSTRAGRRWRKCAERWQTLLWCEEWQLVGDLRLFDLTGEMAAPLLKTDAKADATADGGAGGLGIELAVTLALTLTLILAPNPNPNPNPDTNPNPTRWPPRALLRAGRAWPSGTQAVGAGGRRGARPRGLHPPRAHVAGGAWGCGLCASTWRGAYGAAASST